MLFNSRSMMICKRSRNNVLNFMTSRSRRCYTEGESPKPMFKDIEGESKYHKSNKIFRGEVNKRLDVFLFLNILTGFSKTINIQTIR